MDYRKSIVFEIVLVSPEMAARWLESAHRNRTILKRHVSRLAFDMSNGRYALTHQGVAFDTDDRLIDGEHRLRAIVISEKPQWLVVCRYRDAELAGVARKHLDAGARRRVGEQMEILGMLPDAGRDRIAVAALLAGIDHGVGGTASFDVETYAVDYCEHHTEVRQRLPKTIAAPPVAAFVWMRELAPASVDALAEKVRTGVGLNHTEALLARVIAERVPGGSEMRLGHALKAIRLIEACLNGEVLLRVQEQTRSVLIARLASKKAAA